MTRGPRGVLREVALAPKLGLLVDLDGTLIPIVDSPCHTGIDPEVLEILAELAIARDTLVAVVSGRPRDALDERVGSVPGLLLVAEHGAWRKDEAGWSLRPLLGTPPDAARQALEKIASAYPGALVEPKTWSVCLHYRNVARARREALLVDATDEMKRWIAIHPEYEVMEAAAAIELRHRDAQKGSAVSFVRERAGRDALLIALGDDVTDEDVFASLGTEDAAILVGDSARPSLANLRLAGPPEVRSFLRWVIGERGRLERHRGALLPSEAPASKQRADLLVVANRLPNLDSGPSRTRNVGGLVAALEPALASRGGIWLGASGRAPREGSDPLVTRDAGAFTLASLDLSPGDEELYYNGFSNRSLWPLFHSLPGRARFVDEEWRAYVAVNQRFAEAALRLATKSGTIWIHDYHLLLVAGALRRGDFTGRLGFFLHIPFPPLDLFETIPWFADLLEGMLAFDWLGFHTRRYANNFVACAIELMGAARTEAGVMFRGREVRVGSFPLGIDASDFEDPGEDEESNAEIGRLESALGDRKLLLGVDRLDYTKGIPERLEAFARMLTLHPEWRKQVSFLQVAVPSRAAVPEYAEQRTQIEGLVGRINGEFGEADWVPVRYLYRSYSRAHLARLYRAADVGVVTPLRDGMNLVAKEFVAAQEHSDPGVLLLSRFAGAAEDLEHALLTNPFHRDGMAHDMAAALSMSLEERVALHTKLESKIRQGGSAEWAESFLRAGLVRTAQEHT